jgi:hypothetical protein
VTSECDTSAAVCHASRLRNSPCPHLAQCINVCMCVCVCGYVDMCLCMYVYTYIQTHTYVYIYTYMYIHVYMHTHTHTHTHMYTYNITHNTPAISHMNVLRPPPTTDPRGRTAVTHTVTHTMLFVVRQPEGRKCQKRTNKKTKETYAQNLSCLIPSGPVTSPATSRCCTLPATKKKIQKSMP